MNPELSIKIDYLKDRHNPEEVFEAMALYINAYRDFGQVLSNSIGIKADFNFQLNEIKSGSILSKLSVIPGKIDEILANAFYNSGDELFRELTDIETTDTEEQVETLAVNLESALAKNLPQQIADPNIDRQNLSFALEKFSTANQKIKPNESVIITSNSNNNQNFKFNTKWRFGGKPREMFLGSTESIELNDKLYVTVSVNEGNSVWSFRSISLDKRLSGRITHKEWLERYQDGLIPAIGPKDIIDAKITFDIYTPPKGKGQPQIRNLKVINISNIQRNNGLQYELDT
ncbi:hypothetical protein EEJ88_20390 [Salmonella enterica]|uniref:Uncharacterized protein n=2 Tax=Salmonella enterica subsp. enterica serovar Adelaide TaxID=29473 RepID=A0A6C8GIU4_SALET|nr:hypothetical protein [Salmonella enterica]EAA7339619.1 hypothetical protein [Salmonella enterica subsp. enterica]EBH8626351.1 hypothetical protein [Salmonella enterica subsp. enterica serovar Tees]ECV3493723.1 hypothetical protein [Salmonella enterica subsp. enterica serovar Derby]EDV1983416.1 hypothetical protein [Salmonella enterica subsp. enterica serovar Ealing]EED2912737.1 hypothetical protein [Salmonella enterica subsp. enterica serovar Anecho]EHC33371.1 hypothetical protein LTSEADE_